MFGSRLNNDGRMVFPFAIAEAQDLGDPSLGPEHLVLGVLCNARDPLVGVLAENGITLQTARDAVSGIENQEEAEPASDEDRYSADRDALKTLGIDLDKVRDAVEKNFGDDLTRGWGRRDDRRGHRGGPHGRRGGPHGRHGDPRERGGRGFAGRDGGGFGRAGFDRGDFDPRDFDPRDFGRGPWGEGPWGGDGPWDQGRGRRGPRGRRPRFAPSTKRVVAQAMRIAAEDYGTRVMSTGHVLLAAFDSDSPRVAAIVALAPDAGVLRDAIEERLAAGADA
ncbi:Clp protease N-terminal domain-containing protein [Gordonia sp. (in: high G+C Gram-positive bacteria)]|uniref:Clp protease N-terminal domain-containing protein n=1 Tax=Gordonia sp. (in: high G+C Gram-positive bacteria) TaxID=84139 RepID=UPI0039E65E79